MKKQPTGNHPPQSVALVWSWRFFLSVIALAPLALGTFLGGNSWTSNPSAAPRIFLLTALAAVSLILWFVAFIGNKTTLRFNKALWILLALTALTALSTAFSKSPVEATFGSYDNPIGLLTYFSLGTMLFLATQLVGGSKEIITLAKTVVYSAGVVAGLAWIQRLSGYDFFTAKTIAQAGQTAYTITRGTSTLGNPDFLGHYLVLPSLLALGLFTVSTSRRDRLIYGALFYIVGGACVSTLTRGAIIGLLFGLIAFIAIAALKKYGWKPLALLVAGTLLLSLAIAVPLSEKSNDSVLARFFGGKQSVRTTAVDQADAVASKIAVAAHDSKQAALGGRLLMWRDTPAMIADSPILGAGPANYARAWQLHRSKATLLYGSEAVMTDAHDLLIQYAVTLGIPAALLALVLAGWALFEAIALISKTPKNVEGKQPGASRVLYAAWACGTAAVLVGSLTAMSTISWLMLLYVALGVLLAPNGREIAATPAPSAKGGTPAHASRTIIIVSVGFLCALNVAAALWGVCWLSASVTYRRALNDTKNTLALLNTAARTAPFDVELNENIAQIWLSGAQNLDPSDSKYLPYLNRARQQYAKNSAQTPYDYAPYAGLATASYMTWEATQKSSDMDSGLSYTRKALALNPGAVSLRGIGGYALNRAGRHQDTVALLKGWTNIDPTNTDANSYYAQAIKALSK